MSDDLERAAREAVEAAANTEQLQLIAGILAAQQVVRSQPPACQHTAARPSVSVGKWLAIGMGGSVFLVAFAMSAVAVAISAVALTICLLILREVWNDIRRD